MTRLLIDEPLRSQLNALDGQAEFCDDKGSVLGYFVPASLRQQWLYDWAAAQLSDEELERRSREPGSKTTAEVLEYLKSL
jgi:hypothetical protein